MIPFFDIQPLLSTSSLNKFLPPIVIFLFKIHLLHSIHTVTLNNTTTTDISQSSQDHTVNEGFHKCKGSQILLMLNVLQGQTYLTLLGL